MDKDKGMMRQLTNGILTESMDIGTKEYKDFKLLISSKLNAASRDERIEISLHGLKYQMEDCVQSSPKPTHVGNFIKQFIQLLEITQKNFANYLEIRPSNLSKILSGERRLTIELALILERLSNINAELWLRIQNQNEIHKIQRLNSKRINKYKLNELIK